MWQYSTVLAGKRRKREEKKDAYADWHPIHPIHPSPITPIMPSCTSIRAHVQIKAARVYEDNVAFVKKHNDEVAITKTLLLTQHFCFCVVHSAVVPITI